MYIACIVTRDLRVAHRRSPRDRQRVGARARRRTHFGLEAVTTHDAQWPPKTLSELKRAVDVVDARELARRCDVIVECAPSIAFPVIVRPAAETGRIVVSVSAAALIENMGLVDVARTGARIILATGALLGFHAVRAAARGVIYSVRMVTRKPPRSLLGAPCLEANSIDITNLSAPLRLFTASAREGARGFPANVNVTAALALAGIGPDRTELEIWADPTLNRNPIRSKWMPTARTSK